MTKRRKVRQKKKNEPIANYVALGAISLIGIGTLRNSLLHSSGGGGGGGNPPVATTLSLNYGNQAFTYNGTPIQINLQASLYDQNFNPIAGALIQFTYTNGSNNAPTNSQGVAQIPLTFNNLGVYNLTSSYQSLTANATFTLIPPTSGNPQATVTPTTIYLDTGQLQVTGYGFNTNVTGQFQAFNLAGSNLYQQSFTTDSNGNVNFTVPVSPDTVALLSTFKGVYVFLGDNGNPAGVNVETTANIPLTFINSKILGGGGGGNPPSPSNTVPPFTDYGTTQTGTPQMYARGLTSLTANSYPPYNPAYSKTPPYNTTSIRGIDSSGNVGISFDFNCYNSVSSVNVVTTDSSGNVLTVTSLTCRTDSYSGGLLHAHNDGTAITVDPNSYYLYLVDNINYIVCNADLYNKRQ